ncbi:MAG: hypothetical protein LQ338_000126 [Usnochroma carphineum]|nr:MAG: hypothetical protein LQ338_000126 [Usnochroma carphineum]
MATLLDIDFTFLKPKTRQRLFNFPEVALVALVVIAVKIYYPFDTTSRHPKSITDRGTLSIDWYHWCQIQKDYNAGETAGGKIGRGNEIKVIEADVFKLSRDQMDEYLDWFERTWVDEERARKHPRGYPEQLLDMFPTERPESSSNPTVNPDSERQLDEDALEQKLMAVQGSLRMREVIPDDGDDVRTGERFHRIGSLYKRYKKMGHMLATARAFHEAAASLGAIKLHTLLVAVMQMEHKLFGWRRRQLRSAEESEDDVLESQQEHLGGQQEDTESEQGVEAAKVSTDVLEEENSPMNVVGD